MPRFPEDDCKEIETYKDFTLNGRFVQRHEVGRKSSFHVEVIGSEGFEFEQVVVSHHIDTGKYPDDEAERMMMERTVALAKQRIENDDFETGDQYKTKFKF